MNMLAFSGSALHTMDTKGRVFVPTAYREALGEKFVLWLNNDLRAMAVYPLDEWKANCAALARIPSTDRKGKNYVRYFFGNTFEDWSLDSQGRLLIPPTLREMFGLTEPKDVRFIGVGECLELWAADQYHGLQMSENPLADEALDYVYENYYRLSANENKEG